MQRYIVLVLGGGGGAGAYSADTQNSCGGGGGGGGQVIVSSFNINTNNYNVKLGKGGIGAQHPTESGYNGDSTNIIENDLGSSINITAIGGRGAGCNGTNSGSTGGSVYLDCCLDIQSTDVTGNNGYSILLSDPIVKVCSGGGAVVREFLHIMHFLVEMQV